MNAVVKNIASLSLIEKIEAALLDRLAGEENNQGRRVGGSIPVWVNVESWPNKASDFDFASHDAVLLIHYAASRYADPEGLSINQVRAMTWSFTLLVRSLNGPKGAYRAIEDIRLALQGWSTEGGGAARMVSEELQDEKDGVWEWKILMAFPIPAVAKQHNREGPRPLFKQATPA